MQQTLAAFRARFPDVPVETRVEEKIRPAFEKTLERIARGEPGAVGAVVQDARGHVLLLRHDPATGWPPEAWAIPGGGVAAGETFEAAVEREVREELAMRVEAVRPLLFLRQKLVCGRDHAEYPFVFWRCRPVDPGETPRPRAGEVFEAKWFHKLPKGTFDRDLLLRFLGP